MLCKLNIHKFRRIENPVGKGNHPNCVGECIRCGQIQYVLATPYGGSIPTIYDTLEHCVSAFNKEWLDGLNYEASKRGLVLTATSKKVNGAKVAALRALAGGSPFVQQEAERLIREVIMTLPNDSDFQCHLDQFIWEDNKRLVTDIDRLKATPNQLAKAYLATINK